MVGSLQVPRPLLLCVPVVMMALLGNQQSRVKEQKQLCSWHSLRGGGLVLSCVLAVQPQTVDDVDEL